MTSAVVIDRPDTRRGGRTVRITTSEVTASEVVAVACGDARVEVAPEVEALVAASRAVIEVALAGATPVYGLNTGLGPRRDERVSAVLLADYQRHIVLSHAGAVGRPLDDADSRAVVFARLVGLTRGGSGASPDVLAAMANILNARVHPVIPEIGSVGASDIGALAAVASVLIGHGRARYQGTEMSGADALLAAGLRPAVLAPKDALALISANAVSIGIGAGVALRAAAVARLADLAGALTLEAVGGNLSPFDPEVQQAKPFPGQRDAAASVLAALRGSYLRSGPRTMSVQDPLSIRTIPQVHGAYREQVDRALHAVTVELNGRGDNPLVSPETGRTLSNGNFHPMVMALAFDSLRIGAAHVGGIGERRISKLALRYDGDVSIDQRVRSGAVPRLPMTLTHSAATLSSQLRHLAGPATLSLPPVGHDVEDHGTLAPLTVSQTLRSLEKLELLFSIEILFAAACVAAMPQPPRLGAGTRPVYEAAVTVLDDVLRSPTAAQFVERLRAGLADHVDASAGRLR